MVYNELVSVVMPVHNGERFLREAIESVLNQTYTNFEFLIIENCSTDSSLEIIKSYNDERIELIVENDCGQVQAYNRGFKEARGEYIFIHDQDDISHSERFEKQLKYMLKYNADIVGSFFSVINAKNELLTNVTLPVSHNKIEKGYYYKVIYLYNPTLCIHREVFASYGFFDKNYFPSSDFEFGLRVINKVKVTNIPEILLKWRHHNSSMSHKNINSSTGNALSVAVKYLELRKTQYSDYEYLFIKVHIYYYYNELFKSFKILLNNFRLLDKPLVVLLSKIMFFFIPIKILRVNDLFNTKIIYSIRKYLFFSK